MDHLRQRIAGIAVAILLSGSASASAENAMFSFGEMRAMLRLAAAEEAVPRSDAEIILYQNLQFYSFTVFETLLAANNAALALHRTPLFCAPEATFRFRDEADIARLTERLTGELTALVRAIGATEDHYDDRPASEALLMALRAAFPCPQDVAAARPR